tara:strand:- start:855 stop:1379 length:525 start_codon:yes stop_codon:yes gene_type:complete
MGLKYVNPENDKAKVLFWVIVGLQIGGLLVTLDHPWFKEFVAIWICEMIILLWIWSMYKSLQFDILNRIKTLDNEYKRPEGEQIDRGRVDKEKKEEELKNSGSKESTEKVQMHSSYKSPLREQIEGMKQTTFVKVENKDGEVTCIDCKEILKVPKNHSGNIRCPICKNMMTVDE